MVFFYRFLGHQGQNKMEDIRTQYEIVNFLAFKK